MCSPIIPRICFDPEPYDFSPWHHAKQPHAKDRAFTEYQAKVRQRGAQLMRAFEQKMPGALILTFFHVSLYDRFAALPEEERIKRLEHESWGLMPDFFIGMLEGASPRRGSLTATRTPTTTPHASSIFAPTMPSASAHEL